jgi:hypothetical protein
VTSSLASHFALIYALAVFLPSLVVLLAGSFLTVDRTRSFENNDEGGKYGPMYKTFKPRKMSETIWRFDGGLGGLLTGFLFGRALIFTITPTLHTDLSLISAVSRRIVHFASLLALVIANRTSSAPLSSGAFLTIWMMFSLLFAIGGARWNIVALVIIAILGGCVCHCS